MNKIFMIFCIFIILYAGVRFGIYIFEAICRNINTNVKLQKKDYFIWGTVLFSAYIIFCHEDIAQTALDGKLLIEYIQKGYFFNYYPSVEVSAPYYIPTYILFGFWNLPILAIGRLINPGFWIGNDAITPSSFYLIMWNKLLPVIFYGGCCILIYKIGIKIGLNKNKSQWLAFSWATCPIAVYSMFFYGQYDAIGIFFMLIGFRFYLDNEYTKSAILFGIAATFKSFPLLIFIPLILLSEKKISKVIKYTSISFSGIFICWIITQIGDGISHASAFNQAMFYKLLEYGIELPIGRVPFFATIFVIISMFCYAKKLNSTEEFNKYSIYIPLLVFSLFFLTIHWLGNWMIWLTPFLIISIFQNKNFNLSTWLEIGMFLGYFTNKLVTIDGSLMNFGIIPKLLKHYGDGQSIAHIFYLNKTIPSEIYTSIFIGALIYNLIDKWPKHDNMGDINYINYEEEKIIRKNISLRNMTIISLIILSIALYTSL